MKTFQKKQNWFESHAASKQRHRTLPPTFSPTSHLLLFTFYLLPFTLFLSCRTVPAMIDTSQYIPLEPGAFVYVFADVREAKPILDRLDHYLLNDRQVIQMINRTNHAVAAMYTPNPSSQTMRSLQLVARGNYPAFRARMALGSNKDFKKQRSVQSGSVYWHSVLNKLSLALSSKEAFVALSTGDDPVDPYPGDQRTELPEELHDFHRGAALSCWLTDPGNILNRRLREMAIPLEIPAEQIFISFFTVKDNPVSGGEQHYTVNIKIQVASATLARSLTAIFTIARGFISPETESTNTGTDTFSMLTSVLFSNPPELDGRNLIIKTNAFSSSELALLLNMFLL